MGKNTSVVLGASHEKIHSKAGQVRTIRFRQRSYTRRLDSIGEKRAAARKFALLASDRVRRTVTELRIAVMASGQGMQPLHEPSNNRSSLAQKLSPDPCL